MNPLFYVVTVVIPPSLPIVLQIAWPMPNNWHGTTDCSVTAYCTASVNTHIPTVLQWSAAPPRPGVLTLPPVCVTEGWVTTHTYQMCSSTPEALLLKSLWRPLPSKQNGRTGDKTVFETFTCWQDTQHLFWSSYTLERIRRRRLLFFPTFWNWSGISKNINTKPNRESKAI